MVKNQWKSTLRQCISIWRTELLAGLDHILEFTHLYIDLPLQKVFGYFCDRSSCLKIRRRWLHNLFKTFTTYLVESYFITFSLYFLGFIGGQIFIKSVQRTTFLQPFLFTSDRCISIPFIRMNDVPLELEQLNKNFLRENLILAQEKINENFDDDSALNTFFELFADTYFIVCQRSLYLYARFQVYSSLLHSNFSYYRFQLGDFPRPFALDRPPFLDLCLHANNRSHLNHLIARLRPIASVYYPSVNLFQFDFNWTQVTVTLYQLESNSTHLERISIHTGWLYDLYKQIDSFKYQRALSTVLFDGLALQETSLRYFQRISLPLPSDPLLALNEMIEQDLITLPFC